MPIANDLSSIFAPSVVSTNQYPLSMLHMVTNLYRVRKQIFPFRHTTPAIAIASTPTALQIWHCQLFLALCSQPHPTKHHHHPSMLEAPRKQCTLAKPTRERNIKPPTTPFCCFINRCLTRTRLGFFGCQVRSHFSRN
jgi:hypothetical protein